MGAETDYLLRIASVHQTKAEAFLVNKNFTIDKGNKTLIRVENPAISFIDVIHLFYPKIKAHEGIHPSAVISDTVQIGKDVQIAPHAVIEKMYTLLIVYR